MAIIGEMMRKAETDGYTGANATAKVCQDIVLNGIARSSLSRNVTIKGGVVMRSISDDSRRATQDLDIDFIKYSLSDESVDRFIKKLNNVEDITIEREGEITELSQQDYHGKRVFVRITDSEGYSITSKIDLGVHTHLEIEQEEFCFDIGLNDDCASLLINSKEQMFVEKLRSLLKFGAASTRYKDIFDMYFLKDLVKKEEMSVCLDEYILLDSGMKEDSISDVIKRVEITFKNRAYRSRLASSDKNWLEIGSDVVMDRLLEYIKSYNS